jgi:ribosomal protein S18 acetylase RimI-like enzyme
MAHAGAQNGSVVTVEVVLGASVDLTQVLDLYDSVGWTAYTRDPERLARALAGSSTVVTATENGELIGIARVVSDGASIAYLQDVLVRPSAQRAGLGRRLVLTALAPYADVRQKVLLTDDEPAQKGFYESLGYRETRDFGEGTLRAFVRFD